jgi:hypothetical protein
MALLRTAFAVLLLLIGAGLARADATYDAFATSLAPTNYWPLSANPNDAVGGINGVCAPACSYGNTIAAHVSGLTPNTAGYVGFSSVAFTNVAGWQFATWLSTSSSANQVVLNTSSAVGPGVYGMNLVISDGGCTTGTIDVQISNNGSLTKLCTSPLVDDGNPHLIFVRCYSGDCEVYIDAVNVGQIAYSFGSYAPRGYSFANYEVTPVPLLGAMGSVEFWAGGTPLSPGTIQALYTCGTTGVCAAPASGCPSPPSPLFCETFETYSGASDLTTLPPTLFQPYLDAQTLGGGVIDNGTLCNSGTFLTLPGAHVGDEVIGTPGSVTTCGGIPLGPGWDFGEIVASGGGPNGTISATAGFGGVNGVNLTAYNADAQGSCSISGTTLTVSSTYVGAFAPGQFLYDMSAAITTGTYIVSGSGSTFTVSVSQAATPTTPCLGTLWGNLAGRPNVRVFSNYSYSGLQSGGVGTTGTGAFMAREFTANITEGYVAAAVYFTAGNSTNWATAGPGVGNVSNTGSYTDGILINFYTNGGPPNSMTMNYGAGNACTMTGSPFTFVPNTWHQVVMAWRSANDASGYIKVYWDGALVGSAFGANQGPCSFPTTLNAVSLNAEGSAASPVAEWFVDNVGPYNAVYGLTGGPQVRLME